MFDAPESSSSSSSGSGDDFDPLATIWKLKGYLVALAGVVFCAAGLIVGGILSFLLFLPGIVMLLVAGQSLADKFEVDASMFEHMLDDDG